MNKEKEIQILANAVLDVAISWNYDNSYEYYYCIFCHNNVPETETRDSIKHKLDCPYLIAKDLTTKL